MTKMVIRKDKDKVEIEKELEFYLKQDDDGIILVCKSYEGGTWNILAIDNNGKCYFMDDVPDDIGLQVDENGCIVIEDE